MEIWHGVTDGMVAVTGLWAGSHLIRHSNNHSQFYMGWSLAIIGLASTVGAIKYFTGLYDLLDGLHNAMAQVSGTTCMLLMALAGLALLRPAFVAKLPQWTMLAGCIGFYFLVAAINQFDTVRMVDTLIAIAIVFWSGWHIRQSGDPKRGNLGMITAVMLFANGAIAYGIFKEPLSFILFHAVLSVWIMMAWKYFRA